MLIALILFVAFVALLLLDFWTSRRAGLDATKTGTTFAWPLMVAMWVGAILAQIVQEVSK